MISFYQESIPVEERVTKTRSKTLAHDSPMGKKGTVVQASVTEWSNPLKPEDEEATEDYLQLGEEIESQF